MTKYEAFRVTVQGGLGSKLQIVKPPGVSVTDPPDLPMDALQKRTIEMLSSYLADDLVRTPDELAVLGSQLFRGLFAEEAARLFVDALKKVREKPDSVLRLVLEFTDAAHELAELPWEYLYVPDGLLGAGRGFFVAANAESRLILARQIPLQDAGPELDPDVEPLRILIVTSQPEEYPAGERELGQVMTKKVVDCITELDAKSGGRIKTEQLRQPSKRALADAVKQFEPHIVHFMGHGKYAADKQRGSLAFVLEDGKTLSWLSDNELPDYIVPMPRLVFLHACEGANSNSYESFRGVALALVYAGVPAVVALRYQVQNKVASEFALRFYESLGEGKPIDAAVQDGRKELRMYLGDPETNGRAFGSPVVFLRSANEIIRIPELAAPAPAAPQGPATPAAEPKTIRCIVCNQAYVSKKGICSNCNSAYDPCENCGEWAARKHPVCQNCGEPPRRAAAGSVDPDAQRRADVTGPTRYEPVQPSPVAAAELSGLAPRAPKESNTPAPEESGWTPNGNG